MQIKLFISFLSVNRLIQDKAAASFQWKEPATVITRL